ncbi:hypothetical protein Tco_1434950 [Tanacetum coccineum]
MHKTALVSEANENVAKVQEKLMEEDTKKMVDDAEEESYASEFADLVFQDDDDDSGNRIEPGSHKKNLEIIDDEEEYAEEKKDDKKDDDKKKDNEDNDNNDHIDHTLVGTQVTSSSIAGMRRRRGKIRKLLKTTFVTNEYFQEKMREIPDLLKNLVPEITIAKTNEMIKEAPRLVDLAIKRDRETAPTNVHELISKEFATHAPRIIRELFQSHMQNTVLNLYPTISSSTTTSIVFNNEDKSSRSIS